MQKIMLKIIFDIQIQKNTSGTFVDDEESQIDYFSILFLDI